MRAVPPVLHQTMRLSPGRHRSPDDGACAMELASLLAGTSFSDRCVRVCPIVGAFVRGYNDRIDDDRRQDLIPVVPELVDTRAPDDVVDARAGLCLRFAREAFADRRWRLWRPHFLHATREANIELAAHIAADAALRRPAWHTRTMRLIGTLIRMGRPQLPPPVQSTASISIEIPGRSDWMVVRTGRGSGTISS
jgi:hypothetical protein